LQTRKWENAFTIDKNSWGLNRNATLSDYMTVAELVHTLIKVVAFNGNFLLNLGPGPDGTINPIFIDRLLGIGTMRLIRMLGCTLLCLRRRSLTDSFHLFCLFIRRVVEGVFCCVFLVVCAWAMDLLTD